MKNKALFLIFIFVFLSASVFALEIKSKEVFMQGETFQATISGNFLKNIQIQDVGFYSGHVQVPVTYDMAKINNTYYIYALLPYKSENYTIKIKDAYFKEQNKVQIMDIEKNFLINNQTAEFTVQPGFIVTNKNFIITLQNNKDLGIAIAYSFENNSDSLLVPAQDSKTIDISIDKVPETIMTTLKITSGTFAYDLPLYIIKNKTSFDDGIIAGRDMLDFNISSLTDTLKTGETFQHSIELANIGDRETGQINFSISDNLNNSIILTPIKSDSVKPDQSIIINFTAKFLKSGDYSGFIQASSAKSYDRLMVKFVVRDNAIVNSSIEGKKTCSQLNGKICTSEQICTGSYVVSSEGYSCCIGTCNAATQLSSPSRNWIMVIASIFVILIIGAFLWFKFKKPKMLNSSDILKKKTESFEERFETSGKLSKV